MAEEIIVQDAGEIEKIITGEGQAKAQNFEEHITFFIRDTLKIFNYFLFNVIKYSAIGGGLTAGVVTVLIGVGIIRI